MYLVLYVDDEEDLLDIGKSFLEETREYDIITCSSAPGALEALRSQPFDAIVSDYQMPGMDGIELLKRIREQFGDLPFVLFTGKGREEVVIQAIDHGADFYLQKGGDPSSAYAELSHKLRQAIEKKRAEASLRINEERLPMTQGIGRIGSWEYNPETRQFWASEDAFKIFGLPVSHDGMVSLEDVAARIPDWDKAREALNTLLNTVDEYSIELAVEPANSPERRVINCVARLDRDNHGNVRKISGVAQDISDRKRSEEQVTRERQNFLAILSTAPVGLMLVDGDRRITQTNRYFSSIFSGSQEGMTGTRVGEAIRCVHSSEDPSGCGSSARCPECPLRTCLDRVQKDGLILNGEVIELTLKDGDSIQERCFSLNGEPIELEGRKYALVAVDDITAEREYEQERIRKSEELHAAYEQIAATEGELRQNYEDLVRSGERLRESEQRYRSLFDHLIDGFALHEIVMGEDGCPAEYRILDVNPAFEKLLGISREQVVGALSCDAYGTEFPPYLAEYSGVALNGLPYSFETFFPPLNKHFSITAYSPSPGYFATVFEDITSRKNAEENLSRKNESLAETLEELTATEEELRQSYKELSGSQRLLENSRNYLAAIIEGSPIPTFVIDSDHNITFWNKALGEYLNVPAEAVLGKPLAGQAFYRSPRPSLADLVLDQVLDEIPRWYGEKCSPSSLVDGAYEVADFFPAMRGGTWLFFTASPIYDDAGTRIGAIETLQDITAEAKAEESLKRTNRELEAALRELSASEEELRLNVNELEEGQAALRESEARYRVLFEDSQDALVTIGLPGYRIESCNAAAVQMFGVRDKIHLTGLAPSEISPEFQPDGTRSDEKAEEMQKIALQKGSHMFEWTHKKVGGQSFPCIVLISRIEMGGRTVLFATVRDISGRKRAEEALQRANRQLNLMTSVTRHDIINKIAAILGYLYIAKSKCTDSSMGPYFARIQASTEMIRTLIEDTRVYQSLGSNEPLWQNLNMIITQLKIPDTLKMTVPHKGVSIYADPIVKKVFENLLDNSLRHGKNVTEIRVHTKPIGRDLLLVWQDNGVGIPEDEKEKIFEQGFGKNTGLGLFLVREILSLTKIRIQETGVQGQGARFEMVIPEGAFRDANS